VDYLVPTAGCHINFKKFIPTSTLLQAKDNRFFFVINTGGISRVGTTERVHKNPDNVTATDEEIDYLLASLKKYFPAVHLQKSDIIHKDAGVRPLATSDKQTALTQISREHEIRISKSGMLNVLGVKLTDHRRAAKEVVDLVLKDKSLHHPNVTLKCMTHKTPL